MAGTVQSGSFAKPAGYVEHDNTVRLQSAIGFVTPKDKLEGRDREVFAERDRKLEAAREIRRQRRNDLDAAVSRVVN